MDVIIELLKNDIELQAFCLLAKTYGDDVQIHSISDLESMIDNPVVASAAALYSSSSAAAVASSANHIKIPKGTGLKLVTVFNDKCALLSARMLGLGHVLLSSKKEIVHYVFDNNVLKLNDTTIAIRKKHLHKYFPIFVTFQNILETGLQE